VNCALLCCEVGYVPARAHLAPDAPGPGVHRRGTVPAPLSRARCSRQFGRASAPMMPHRERPYAVGAHVAEGHFRAFSQQLNAEIAVRRLDPGTEFVVSVPPDQTL
jgi:hypothetical protein